MHAASPMTAAAVAAGHFGIIFSTPAKFVADITTTNTAVEIPGFQTVVGGVTVVCATGSATTVMPMKIVGPRRTLRGCFSCHAVPLSTRPGPSFGFGHALTRERQPCISSIAVCCQWDVVSCSLSVCFTRGWLFCWGKRESGARWPSVVDGKVC